jgi:hypothetical protein
MSRSIVLLAVGTALLSGCANSTQMVATWRDPAAPPVVLTKTLAVFMTKEPGLRRMVEDQLAARLPGGVPSYRVLSDDQIASTDSLRERVAGLGFDAAVIMRLADVQTDVSEVGGYGDVYGYWRYWGYAGGPVYYETETRYSVESTLYSLTTGKMIWMARSQTINPKNANKLAEYSVKFAVKNMRRQGVLR